MKLEVEVIYNGNVYVINKFEASSASFPEREAAIKEFYKQHPEMKENSTINIKLVHD